MTILQQINKYRDEIRCSFCMNELIHSTKIHPIKLENREFKGEACYGVLCDDCNAAENRRECKHAVVFLGPNNDKITYIKTNNRTIFSPKLEKKVEKVEAELTEKQEENITVPSTASVIVSAVEGYETAKEAISVGENEEKPK